MDKIPLPTVVAVCGDPGGAEAVAPVLKALQDTGHHILVHALAYREARDIWANHGIPFESLSEDLTVADATGKMREFQASLLFCGTSYNSAELEKRFIAAARGLSIPSLALLDFWSNYLVRFQDSKGQLAFVPDQIAVMDQLAHDELIALGINSDRLVITGQPAFDELTPWKSKFTMERQQANRRTLGVADEEKLVLFASQPLLDLFGVLPEDPLYMGYNEFVVAEALLTALENISIRHATKTTLLLRPHPREKTHWQSHLHSKHVRIIVSSAMDRRDQAMASNLVTGMNSEMLVETCYLGCPTVSLQPELRLPDSLPTNRSGLSRAVYRLEDFQPAIEQMLFDKSIYQEWKTKLVAHHLDDGATQRLVNLINYLIF